MSKISQYIVEQEELGNDVMAKYESEVRPTTKRSEYPARIGKGVWFQDEFEMWHRNPYADGKIIRVMVHGVQFEKASFEYLDEAAKDDDNPVF